MASLFTKRFILLVRADLAAKGNLAASQPDTDDGGKGDQTFTVGLSATGAPPATAYWCNWAMTMPQALAIRARLRGQGATVAEVALIPAGGTPATTRFAVFDADDWPDPEAVLTAVGLKRLTGGLL